MYIFQFVHLASWRATVQTAGSASSNNGGVMAKTIVKMEKTRRTVVRSGEKWGKMGDGGMGNGGMGNGGMGEMGEWGNGGMRE